MGSMAGPTSPQTSRAGGAAAGACSTTQVPSSARERLADARHEADAAASMGATAAWRTPVATSMVARTAAPAGWTASTARSALTVSLGRVPIRSDRCRRRILGPRESATAATSVGLRDLDRRAARPAADVGDPRSLRADRLGHAADGDGKGGVRRFGFPERAERAAGQDLAAAQHDGRVARLERGVERRLRAREAEHPASLLGGPRVKPEVRLHHDAERAEGPDVELRDVVAADVLDHAAPRP